MIPALVSAFAAYDRVVDFADRLFPKHRVFNYGGDWFVEMGTKLSPDNSELKYVYQFARRTKAGFVVDPAHQLKTSLPLDARGYNSIQTRRVWQ